jgi:hypothetical protein
MTNKIGFELALRFQEPPPEALIQFETDALRFIVCGVEAFRLTSSGMEYKGQVVEDAGVAYREITEFFSAAKETKNYQPTSEGGYN